MTDSMGPGKLVRYMQNLSYTYDEYLICIGLGPSIQSVICKNPSYSGPSYPSSPVVAPTACLEAINWLRWPPPVHLFSVYKNVFKQQYTSCMKVGTDGKLGLGREYHKKLFGPLFYTWWNCPLSINGLIQVQLL